jgi:hypothetical protein
MTTTTQTTTTYLALRGDPCQCPACVQEREDEDYGVKVARAAVALAESRKSTLARRLNRVQIALACLTTLGTIAVGVCAALAPSLTMSVVAAGCGITTAIHWQLCD